MSTANQVAEIGDSVAGASSSRRSVWMGRVLGGVDVLFLIPDGIIKFIKAAPVAEAFALGAILLTGYLGGAVRLRSVIPLRG